MRVFEYTTEDPYTDALVTIRVTEEEAIGEMQRIAEYYEHPIIFGGSNEEILAAFKTIHNAIEVTE